MTLKAPTFQLSFTLTNNMTATLSMPKSAALGMLSKAENGAQMLEILDAVIDTQEDQVPMVTDAYIMENDYADDFDF